MRFVSYYSPDQLVNNILSVFNRRLDKLLYIILKIARDKAFQQLCKKEKGKHTN